MKILSFDSKLMQTFRLLFDYMGLNLVFLVCCVPVITIGTARTAFYTAMRAMQRNEPWFVLYWQTLAKSLKQPTIVWCICLPLVCAFSIYAYSTFSQGQTFLGIVFSVCLGIAMCIASLSPMFFSRFDCTVMELVRNSFAMILAFPLRVVLGTALTWAPVAFMFLKILHWVIYEWFFVFLLLYFSLVGALFTWMMRYPFGRLTGEVPEKKESYLIREAKKNIEKLDEVLIDKNK